jgi:hypothetical protein
MDFYRTGIQYRVNGSLNIAPQIAQVRSSKTFVFPGIKKE